MQTIQDSISPVWEEPFRFMIHDPNYQELDIEVQIHSLIMAQETVFLASQKML